MRILVFSPYAWSTPHFETELDIIQQHLDLGHEVKVLTCGGDMTACDINPDHQLSKCILCTETCKRGLSRLAPSPGHSRYLKLNYTDKQSIRAGSISVSSNEELMAIKIEDFLIGNAVLSSIVSLLRDPYPDFRQHSQLLSDLYQTSLAAYRSMQRHIDNYKPDKVYCFNGRFAPLAAAISACKSRGVECIVHERGCDMHHYSLRINTTIHDADQYKAEMAECWLSGESDIDRDSSASSFYIMKRGGADVGWYSFTREQSPDLLPSECDASKKQIGIFLSSEDEFVALPGWENPIYRDQLDGLTKIVDSLIKCQHNLHLFVRLHPSLRDLHNPYTEKLRNLHAPFLTVIQPESPVSSYALLDKVDTVLTFGSTLGIEAVYWGKPSILAGRAFYAYLGATYSPTTHVELVHLLQSDLIPHDRRAALIYGYYTSKYGVPYKYYKPIALSDGLFKGVRLEPTRWGYRRRYVAVLLSRVTRVFDRLHRRLIRWRIAGQ